MKKQYKKSRPARDMPGARCTLTNMFTYAEQDRRIAEIVKRQPDYGAPAPSPPAPKRTRGEVIA